MSIDPDRLSAWVDRLCDGDPPAWEHERARASSEDERRALDALLLLDAVSRLAGMEASLRTDEIPFPTWGPLRLVRRLGAGARSDVYEAYDPTLDRSVALKLFRTEGEGDAPAGSRLLQEARHLARLQSPSIATVLGVEVHRGRVGLWMELIEGRDLGTRVTEEGPFSEAAAMRTCLQIADGLRALHDAGILHCDLKAQNVVLDRSGRAILVDLGEARRIDRVEIGAGSEHSGTPLYMSPSVLRGERWTMQDDLYSFGVLLHHLLTGGFPYPAHSTEHLLTLQATREPSPVRDVAPWVSIEGQEIVRRCLQAGRADGYATVAQLRSDLRARTTTVEATPNSRRTAGPTRGRALTAVALIGFVALVLARVAGVPWHSSSPNDPQVLFHEDFDPAFDPRDDRRFRVDDFDPQLWDPTRNPGALTLFTHQGDTWNEVRSGMRARNIVSIAAPKEPFEVTVRLVDFWPQHNWQQAGLLIMENQGNYVRLGVASSLTYVDGEPQQQQRCQAVFERNGEVLETRSVALAKSDTEAGTPFVPLLAEDGPIQEIWLRITRHGDHWKTQYSEQGVTYRTVMEIDFVLHAPRIGLYALHGIGHTGLRDLQWDPIPAVFDEIVVHRLPEGDR